MLEAFARWLFDPSGLTAHGFCLVWEPGLIWTHALSDIAVGLAYFTIPVQLAIFARRRRDLVFRPVFWLFAAFILLCGTTHWISLLTLWVPVYGLEGAVKAVTAAVSIVTAIAVWRLLPRALALPSPAQLREADAATRASEARYRLVAENSMDLIVLRPLADGGQAYASPAVRSVIGYEPDAFLAADPATYLHPDDAERVAAEWASLSEDAPMTTSLHRLRHKAGRWVWVEAVLQLANSGTAEASLLMTARDVTARLHAEETLRKNEAHYRLLAEHSNDMIALKPSFTGGRTYVSPASRSLLGYEPEEFAVLDPAVFVHPEDLGRLFDELATLSQSTPTVTSLHRLRHKAGHYVWVETAYRLAHPGTDEQILVVTSRDVSERHRFEAEREARGRELEASNAALERLARHLARARDEAERASGAKSRFLAGMSHELRTPLNGVIGYAQLLRIEGELSPLQSTRVEAMLDAGSHLLRMINGVLDLSEIEAERVQLHADQLDLRSIAEACLDLVRPAAEAKRLTLDLIIAPAAPARLMADPTRLRQILVNLLGNAVKFTSRGGVSLRLTLAAPTTLRIEVVDTGPGIPAERRRRLFQDFERLDAGNDGTVEGAGLGLAISSRLANLMGGTLDYQDNPGGGSVFRLDLPITSAVPDINPAISGTATPSAHRPRQVLHILVVDDVAMNRDIAGSFLRAAGHHVTCAEGGAEAVQFAAASAFDVVLMDVRMPVIDGLEATRRIRALAGEHGRVPIVAVTAQAFAEQVDQCRSAGMDSHLSKPFTPEALLEAVIRASASQKAPAASQPGLTEAA